MDKLKAVARALELLSRVEAEEIQLKYIGMHPQEVYAGNVVYLTPSGWRLIVFNDCNGWDYLDSIISPDGELVDFWEGPDHEFGPDHEKLLSWRPHGDKESTWRQWGIPGYLAHRPSEDGSPERAEDVDG